MANLLAAAVFFVGIHLLVSGTILRDKLMATIGEKPYLLTFSLTSLGGFIWMIAAYRGLATDISFWTAPNGLIHLGPIFISLSFVLAIAGLTTPNPTSVQSTGLLEKETAVGGIITVTRHPFNGPSCSGRPITCWRVVSYQQQSSLGPLRYSHSLALLRSIRNGHESSERSGSPLRIRPPTCLLLRWFKGERNSTFEVLGGLESWSAPFSTAWLYTFIIVGLVFRPCQGSLRSRAAAKQPNGQTP